MYICVYIYIYILYSGVCQALLSQKPPSAWTCFNNTNNMFSAVCIYVHMCVYIYIYRHRSHIVCFQPCWSGQEPVPERRCAQRPADVPYPPFYVFIYVLFISLLLLLLFLYV